MTGEKPEESVSRRKVVTALGTGAMISLAGCPSQSGDGGDGDGDDGGSDGSDDGSDGDGGDLGERVPTVVITFFTDQGGWSAEAEKFLPTVRDNMQNRLGVDVELKGQEVGGLIPSTIEDQQTEHLHLWPQGLSPDRLDPDEYTQAFTADGAGNPNALNHANYASCEYSTPAELQTSAPNVKRRHELVNEAWSVGSEDGIAIPATQIFVFGAYRSDMVEVPDLGNRGLGANPTVPARTTLKEGDQLLFPTQPYVTEHPNFPMSPASEALRIWCKMIHSPLLSWSNDFELYGMLAEDWEIANEAKQFTISLRDATFHNGDPITAEDVQFTFRHLWDNAEVFPLVTPVEYDSIEVVDDKTVEFNFPQSQLLFQNKILTKWGIIHKQSWVEGGAQDNPQEFTPDPLIASGPFQMTSVKEGQNIIATGHDGHPQFSPDHDLFIQAFASGESEANAFRSGELHFTDGSRDRMQQLKSDLGDSMTRVNTRGFLSMNFHPQHSFGPTQFPVFNRAFGAVINRAKINGLVYNNDADMEAASYGCMFQPGHPYRPPEDQLYQYTDNMQGDEEKARNLLTDAGWGWDDDGNLRYPADVDPSPQWPDDGRPDPAGYPCYDGEWNFVPPEER